MGWFGRKREVIDFSEQYKRKQEKSAEIQNKNKIQPAPFSIFGSIPEVKTSNSTPAQDSGEDDFLSPDEKKKKLAKRLMDITDKLEDLSNQIYHLQQRIEVIEQKMRVGVGG